MAIQNFLGNSAGGLVVNTSNVVVGTTSRFENWNNEGYLYGFIAINATAVTITILGTSDNQSIANTSASFVDIGQTLFGAASFSGLIEFLIDTPCAFDRIRIDMNATNATNSTTIRVNKSH